LSNIANARTRIAGPSVCVSSDEDPARVSKLFKVDVQFGLSQGISLRARAWRGLNPIDQEPLIIQLLRERVKLLAYIRAIVRDDHLAEDVFQEIAVLAVRKRHEIRDERHFLGWMRLASRHQALKVLRRRQHHLLLDEALLDRLEEQWAEQDHDSSADLLEALRYCLDRLSPYAQNLVKLRYAEGVSGERLAEIVDRSLNTVYVALTRIHRSLGNCIKQRLA
jgi:RNA polymerase sigma-70 factor (ECF subfamily)